MKWDPHSLSLALFEHLKQLCVKKRRRRRSLLKEKESRVEEATMRLNICPASRDGWAWGHSLADGDLKNLNPRGRIGVLCNRHWRIF